MPEINQFNLSDASLVTILQSMHVTQFTGWLETRRNISIKKIYYLQGEIIFASSNELSDRMGEILVKNDRLHRNLLEKALRMQEKGKLFGTILVEKKFITPEDLVWVVKTQARQIVTSIFNWDDGIIAVIADSFPDEVIQLNLKLELLLAEGIRTITNPRIIMRGVGEMEKQLAITPTPLMMIRGFDCLAEGAGTDAGGL